MPIITWALRSNPIPLSINRIKYFKKLHKYIDDEYRIEGSSKGSREKELEGKMKRR